MSFVQDDNGVQNIDMEHLITVYGNAIFRMCFAYLKDRGLAEDAVQETFVKAYRQYATFRHEGSEKAWLSAIAINTCKDAQKSSWFRHIDRRITLDKLPEPRCEFDSADDTLILAVMALPSKWKDVILLRYYQGLSFEEISKALHIPIGTVSTRIDAAKKKLRKKLEGGYFDESKNRPGGL